MSRAYYNEFDPKAAATLRELIACGHIAPGDVDERSIEDVLPSELTGYTQCHFFAGFGIWSLALRQAGWPDNRPVWTGSCPCQPFSAAGKGAGFDDERHLWPAFFHLIQHGKRSDVPMLGGSASQGWEECSNERSSDAVGSGLPSPTNGFWGSVDWLRCRDDKWRPVEPGTFPLAHGYPERVGILRGAGNAISPEVAKAFIQVTEQWV